MGESCRYYMQLSLQISLHSRGKSLFVELRQYTFAMLRNRSPPPRKKVAKYMLRVNYSEMLLHSRGGIQRDPKRLGFGFQTCPNYQNSSKITL